MLGNVDKGSFFAIFGTMLYAVIFYLHSQIKNPQGVHALVSPKLIIHIKHSLKPEPKT